ncbi:MAG: sulfite exporter TauE/SafE family protein [Candidatus Eiseniibacteriota bacterium]|nr:MAG: sulfite exporter TauE/SafE family protein [Candidatus Eisenbacteria bacterium]
MIEIQFWHYALFGVFAGCYATIVGLGGGFLVVPALVLFAGFTPQQAVATSLVVVFANAASGNVSYLRQKRVDIATGWRFGLASIPGSLVGVQISTYFTSAVFNVVFGVLLVAASLFLMVKPGKAVRSSETDGLPRAGLTCRRLVDCWGGVHEYSFNMKTGLLLSFFAGIISALFGVGGGIVYVPALILLFGFPPHIATATSFFVLLISSLAGAVFHGLYLHPVYSAGFSIAVGAVIGAQIGAAVSRSMKAPLLVRLFAGALLLVGLRLVLG